MIKLTGLWSNKSSSGETYLSGKIGRGRILILKNKLKKEGSNEPDYELCIVEQEQITQKEGLHDGLD